MLTPVNDLGDDPRRPVLICLPYAGGSARAFGAWGPALSAAGIGLLAVRLPGREELVRRRPYTRPKELVADLANEIAPIASSRPYALFGHSMGAGLAHTLTHEMSRRRYALPDPLVVSAHRAPHLPAPWPPTGDLADTELVDFLRVFGLVSVAALAIPELVELLLPMLRADLALAAAVPCRPRRPLSCRTVVYGGLDDPFVDAPALSAWGAAVLGTPHVRRFPGGHLFPWEHPEEFGRILLADLAALSATTVGEAG
ncbi:thioesterase II family protein [Embleya hyalina]|uniref:Thioesterase n=1 Tax=Embleya hyalina TaxID=516124 RepID=A0A401YQU0_9ACTN|nr:thioesterase domain-containing protein [Embleya hyalina]GCD96978.1 thioesterase [Embleya hyalina]